MELHLRDFHLPKCTECNIPVAAADWDAHMATHAAQAEQQRNAVSKNSRFILSDVKFCYILL